VAERGFGNGNGRKRSEERREKRKCRAGERWQVAGKTSEKGMAACCSDTY